MMEEKIYKILGTKEVSEYYEDYRCGGWTTHSVSVCRCSKCHKEVDKYATFCSHCGSKFVGTKNPAVDSLKKEINKLKRKKQRLVNEINKDNYATNNKLIEEYEEQIEKLQHKLSKV